MRGLDWSFSAPEVTRGWCAARQAEGYKVAAVNLWTGNQSIQGAAQSLQYWQETGGIIAGYYVIHNGRTAEYHFAQAKQSAGALWEDLNFVAIDCEVDTITPAMVLESARLVEDAGVRPMVYTARWFWVDHMGNPTECGTIPLWDANYGTLPSLGPPGYGAWPRRHGHQFQGSTDVGDIEVDLNLFDDAFILEAISIEKDWQTAIDVVNGWSVQLAQASKELADVADILRKLQVRERTYP